MEILAVGCEANTVISWLIIKSLMLFLSITLTFVPRSEQGKARWAEDTLSKSDLNMTLQGSNKLFSFDWMIVSVDLEKMLEVKEILL